jgi:ribosomal-protein-alanine N-acetyltransferase
VTSASEHPPVLDLGDARLRPLRTTDADALFGYLCDPRVTERTSFPEVTRQFALGMIERAIGRWGAGEPSKWGLVDADDRLVGTCGFNEWSPVHRWAEIAFDLAPSEWGKGSMRRAATAVIDWAFASDRIDRVHAYVRVDNLRSQGLLERLGFLREGRLRSYRICRGVPHDFYVYATLRAERAAT